MNRFPIFLLLAGLLAVGCGGGENKPAANSKEALLKRAKVAEGNLVKIRDAVVKYHARNDKVPFSLTALQGYGGGEADLKVNDDYTELAYGYEPENIKFNEEGELTQGWFYATPVADSDAYKVRMNGVTGEFDYVPAGKEFKPADSDTAWKEQNEASPAD